MRYLLDTNVLLRFALANEVEHAVVVRAVKTLLAQGHSVHFSPQSVRELWHVCTRSAAANGIGLRASEVTVIVEELRATLDLLDDAPGTFEGWLDLVSSLAVSGARTHDANHAAFAKNRGIDIILTFDSNDFNRFQLAGIGVLSPSDIPL